MCCIQVLIWTTVQVYSRNISFKVFRKAILPAETARNPFFFCGGAPDSLREITAPQVP